MKFLEGLIAYAKSIIVMFTIVISSFDSSFYSLVARQFHRSLFIEHLVYYFALFFCCLFGMLNFAVKLLPYDNAVRTDSLIVGERLCTVISLSAASFSIAIWSIS